MKNELKNELHQLIDAIDDEDVLHVLKEDIASYTQAETTDGLTKEQLEHLDLSIEQADNEKQLHSWDELKKDIQEKWREK